MQMECTIVRAGSTPIVLPTGAGRAPIKYIFSPNPHLRPREEGTSVCEVTMESHLEWMKKHPGHYREYDSDRTRKEVEQRRKELKANDAAGFSFPKYKDKGYVVQDAREPKKVRYMDKRGAWSDSFDNLEPFATQLDANDWLKTNLAEILNEKKK
jgi:hypothetical protein